MEITLNNGTVITDQIGEGDAHPPGARPFTRAQYVNKFRTLAAGSVEEKDFLAVAEGLGDPGPGELDRLNHTAVLGIIDLSDAPPGLFYMLYSSCLWHHPAVPGCFQPALCPAH